MGIAKRRGLDQVLSLDDFEALARRRLPRPIFAYICGGAERNTSLEENLKSFHEYSFVPSALSDVSVVRPSVDLFGHTYSGPFGIAPFGLSALAAYRGDLVLARSAQRANVPMIMSGSSLIRLEEVAAQSPQAWFQAYLPGDESGIDALIDRVKAAGILTLVITVDMPVSGNRENNVRAGFSTPLRPTLRLLLEGATHPSWLIGTFLQTCIRHGMPHFENNYATRGAPILSPSVLRDFSDRSKLTWNHLERVRRRWPGPLVIKGILNAADTRHACSLGADGIIVSNHGGRQLDGSIAPLRVLPEIVIAAGAVPVMLDGGVRRGTDVLKAILLGAKMVFIARPFAYASAVAGAAGVDHAIDIMSAEVGRDMALLGLTSLQNVGGMPLLRRTKTLC